MADEEAEALDGRGLENGGLQRHIEHWVEVLDRWVKRIDHGMGRREADGGAEWSGPEGVGVESGPDVDG